MGKTRAQFKKQIQPRKDNKIENGEQSKTLIPDETQPATHLISDQDGTPPIRQENTPLPKQACEQAAVKRMIALDRRRCERLAKTLSELVKAVSSRWASQFVCNMYGSL